MIDPNSKLIAFLCIVLTSWHVRGGKIGRKNVSLLDDSHYPVIVIVIVKKRVLISQLAAASSKDIIFQRLSNSFVNQRRTFLVIKSTYSVLFREPTHQILSNSTIFVIITEINLQ
mgnify:CR=1 FL=1